MVSGTWDSSKDFEIQFIPIAKVDIMNKLGPSGI